MRNFIRRVLWRGPRRFGRPPDFVFGPRPRDRSVQAYRDWIMGMMRQIKPGYTSATSDADWEKRHRVYWEKADAIAGQRKLEKAQRRG